MKGSHANRKAERDERSHATQIIREVYPEYEVVWGSHGDYGGSRAPRDHTLAFRLRDRRGQFHDMMTFGDWLMRVPDDVFAPYYKEFENFAN